MASTSSLTSFAAAIVAAVLTAFLLRLYLHPHVDPVTRSPDQPVSQSCPAGSSCGNAQTSAPHLPNHETDGQVTFLQKMKGYDIREIVPLSPDSEPLLISEIDSFNNKKIAPRLQSIVAMDYFRFVKLNLSKKCHLWAGDDRCSERDCSIAFCPDPPESLVNDDESASDDCSGLSAVNATISSENSETMDSLFECSNDEDGQYIDLLLNPERYTGYRGESARRIWKSIYEENCFFKHQKNVNPFSLDSLCYEERIFYRAISGLHTSINVHLSAAFPVSRHSDHFTHNVNEFVKRFSGNEGYIRNLYFLYLLELRALSKIGPYLMTNVNWQSSGDSAATREAIKNLLENVRTLKSHFNESNLFGDKPAVAHELAEHFRNITSNIMDCVACQKCKLWGKIQMHGLGTAFRILIKESDEREVHSIHLSRHEITSLINAISKLGKSIQLLEEFDHLLMHPLPHKQRRAEHVPYKFT